MAYAPDSALIATPIGMVLIEGDGVLLTAIRIDPRSGAAERRGESAMVREAEGQIRAYFADGSARFKLALAPAATARGQVLRETIAGVAAGETASYGALSRTANSSPRAVGQACARNPFPIVIPCHRILGDGGRLGAYSAGAGPATKAWLLAHEGMKGPLL